ncbi:hypothetical protein TOTORO_03280 [Serratia phage vB_SmaS-Totoro]|nr:hypothetical protein TOTORO_03280 [Serratia phage vB_SmaS-Totoro]
MTINKRSVKIEIRPVARVIEIDTDTPIAEQMASVMGDVNELLHIAGYGEMAKKGVIQDIESHLPPALKSPRPYSFQVSGFIKAFVTLSEVGQPETLFPDDSDLNDRPNHHRLYEELRDGLERSGTYSRNRRQNGNQAARRGYGIADRRDGFRNDYGIQRNEAGIKLEYCGRVKTLEVDHAYTWVIQGITEDLCRENPRLGKRETFIIEEHLTATLEYLLRSPYGTKVALGVQFKGATLELVNLRKGRDIPFTEMFNNPEYWDAPESE